MRLVAPHHVKFSVRDLDKQEKFANDFGLITVEKTDQRLVMRTRGGDMACYIAVKGDEDKFLSVAFEAEDAQVLDDAVAEHGAVELDTGNWGGNVERAVALTDPDGYQVVIVSGVTRREAEEAYEPLVFNTPFKKDRIGRQQPARAIGPARLWGFGHLAIYVKSFPASAAWYEEKLGLIASDIYHVPGMPKVNIVGFFRLNRGEEYVQHHVVALMQDENATGTHHISFEAQDYEAQQRTHRYLDDQDYDLVWGVGRHPQGSHIFDVWKGPDGARFETYSDTDMFNDTHDTNYFDISHTDVDVWLTEGPERYFL